LKKKIEKSCSTDVASANLNQTLETETFTFIRFYCPKMFEKKSAAVFVKLKSTREHKFAIDSGRN
jgi:hypothetical protein